jgi:OOP family OmpA-OmpF porin
VRISIGIWMGVAAAVVAAACSKAVEFQGKSTLSVVGTPPAAPAVVVAPPRVEVRDNKIEIREKIQFDYNKATIKEESFSLMKEIAEVMTKNTHLKRIQIEGHASSEGSAAHNTRLSDDRAKAVMAWLTANGVAADRLTAIGFGIDRPIADNGTETGREANRRVEFLIVEQVLTKQKVEVGANGVEKVLGVEQETVKATPASATVNVKEKSAGAKGVAQ